MSPAEQTARLLQENPAVSIFAAVSFALSLGALLGLILFLKRAPVPFFDRFTVPPLRLPAVDVAALFISLWCMMFISIGHGAVLVGVIWLLRFHKVDLRAQWGLGQLSVVALIGLTLWIYLAAVGIIGPLSSVIEFLAQRFHWNNSTQPAVEYLLQVRDPVRLGWLLFLAVALAPAAEEILFRGLLHPFFKSQMPVGAAWVLVALLFAFSHLHLLSFVPLFILGLFLAAAYEFTGSLPLCVAIHTLFNAVTAGWLLILRTSH